jgi:hypothetical protein
MNLLNLVGPRLDNIYQIRRKWYYLSGSFFFQFKRGPDFLTISAANETCKNTTVDGYTGVRPCLDQKDPKIFA